MPETCDVVVVGAGDVGAGLAFKAAAAGHSVSLIEKGAVGGTCVNNGCVPSKMLIHAADRIVDAAASARLGVRIQVSGADFGVVMGRMREAVANATAELRAALESEQRIRLVRGAARFLAPRLLEVDGTTFRGRTVFIASGSRPVVPTVPGLDALAYLTNETVLGLEAQPASLVMLGGGYVGLEYAHFFSALGTRVTVVEQGERLLPFEEPEISALLEQSLRGRMDLLLGTSVVGVAPGGAGCVATVRGRDGNTAQIPAERVFVAAGRTSNAELLQPERGGIALDERGYVRVDDFLRTSQRSVWALGDAIGRAMFTHAGDREAVIAWHNASQRGKIRMHFDAVPHAVFVAPQIASVGLTEARARATGQPVLVGTARYADTVLGKAMDEREGFAKAVVDAQTRRILGFHVVGPHASLLLPEVANAVMRGERVEAITDCMHVFPALSDLVTEAFSNLA
jgi:dihydrolipoamide dehydrogenase